jgi:hypothetical protein
MDNNIIKIYLDYKKDNLEYNLDNLLNKVIYMFYDKSLDNLYGHIKKCLVITLFLKDLDIILQSYNKNKQNKIKKKFCCCTGKNHTKNNISVDLQITKFIKENKLSNFIDDVLKLYRQRNILNIEEIKKNNRSEYLFILIKYDNNNIYTNDIINIYTNDKLKIINNIIKDIEII